MYYMNTTQHHIEKFQADHISWKTGVAPRTISKWAIVRNSDGKWVETFGKKKDAERALRLMPCTHPTRDARANTDEPWFCPHCKAQA